MKICKPVQFKEKNTKSTVGLPVSFVSLPTEPIILRLVFIIPRGSDFNLVFKVEGSRLDICTSCFLISFPLPHISVL